MEDGNPGRVQREEVRGKGQASVLGRRAEWARWVRENWGACEWRWPVAGAKKDYIRAG